MQAGWLQDLKQEFTHMKIDRSKNAGRNVIFGVLLKIYQILIPFVMRTIMIYFMGVQYLGLNSLFTSILQVLNLAELGVGSAMVYSMYKPIAEDDKKAICALMALYRKYYHIIGIVIAVIGIAILPFIPKLIKSDLPQGINIYILYLLNLAATVLSYWLFAYKNCLLAAYQRTDVTSKVLLITSTIQYALQIGIIIIFKNYYFYIIVMLITQAFTNILTAFIVDKMFPQYKAKGNLNRRKVENINQRIKDLFTAKFGNVIVGSADTIVISSFLGLTLLAVYQNYYFIMNSICGVISVVFTSVTAGIGNSLVTESKEKNYNDLKKFTFIICWILCICCSCFIVLYQPFMELWVGKKFLLPFDMLILFCIYFYVCELSMVWATVKDAAGLWHSDRFRPLAGATVNLILNIILVRYIGLYGILLSTIISYAFVSMPWLVHNLFSLLYRGQNIRQYVGTVLKYIILTIISAFITWFICDQIKVSNLAAIILYGFIALVIPNAIQYVFLKNTKEFKESVKLMTRMIKKRR